ncbi:MAG: cyclic nucleotide-binding domain-containing protein [Armatimonadota bacterium]
MRNSSPAGGLTAPGAEGRESAGGIPPALSITQRLFALKVTPPFDRLRDAELASIAEAAQSRFYADGDLIFGPNRPLQELLVVVSGKWVFAGDNPETSFDDVIGQRVIGVLNLLFDTEAGGSLLTPAGGGGLQCLAVSKAHFFTAVNECPALTAGFLELYHFSDDDAVASSLRPTELAAAP